MKKHTMLLSSLVLLATIVAVYWIAAGPLAEWGKPKPYQEVADALAQYGWEVKDIEVDTIKRTIAMAVIPPEDDEGYVNGFFYILEWADEIIKPPLSEGKPVRGIYPGVLLIGELTPDGPRVLLSNGKAAQTYGTRRIMMLAWEGLSMFLGSDEDGTPWREVFDTSDKIHQGVYQLSWFRMARYGEYGVPAAFVVLDNGWFKESEEPKVEPVEEKK